MSGALPDTVADKPASGQVLAYLADKSAHSDIAEVLEKSVKPLGDAQLFCPDAGAYRYLAASTGGVIFGIAVGKHTVAFRLDERMRERALATGGETLSGAGPEWVAVVHRRSDSDWPAVDVAFWARKAYVFARA